MYKITLCNTIFDRDNDNVLLFDTKQELKSYFDNLTDKYIVGYDINFVANNLINTSIFVTIDNSNNNQLLKILNYNYCIVENNDNNDILYFFITETSQDSGDQVRLSLTIDVINTYWYELSNNTAYIKRSHLDRWVKPYWEPSTTQNRVLAFGEGSKLFEREQLQNVSKRASKRYMLHTEYGKYNTDIDKWYNDNVDHWIYYYLSAGKTYKTIDVNGVENSKELPTISFFTKNVSRETLYNGPFVIIASPVYKTSKRIKIRGKKEDQTIIYSTLQEQSILNFLGANNGYANINAVKHSIKPIADTDLLSSGGATIDANGDLILNNDFNPTIQDNHGYFDISNQVQFAQGCKATQDVFAIITGQNIDVPVKMITPAQMYIDKINLQGVLPENWQEIEPKLYNEDYSTYRLYIGGQMYDLPISKTSSQPCFKYYEIFSPDITKAILTFDSSNDENRQGYSYEKGYYKKEIFTDIQQKDFTGFVINLDLSEWFTVDKLDEFLATNKNNLQIFTNNQELTMLQTNRNEFFRSTTGMIGSAISGDFGGAIKTGAEGIINIISTKEKIDNDKNNYFLTMDNMSQSPQDVRSVNSNPYLIQSLDSFGIYIEFLTPITYEVEKIKNYFKLFGYTCNTIANIKDLIKTRTKYNYIEAIMIDVDINVSEQVKDRIKSVLERGVRFWHADNFTGIDFNQYNIERSLTNG